ncbi:twin-arginine translocase subunit TatC [Brachybacterium sp. UMB0905]|uniref:twin-arginine translocase subunit TatC n=1 Tax=Brachybacterium sp. UMB0905 TaxID=2069310 RepID=UPI001E3C934D|nr:twin-arginine translocase subunit TatC [Brachybacterium sp. UMB0905]
MADETRDRGRSAPAKPAKKPRKDPEGRMSLGEHLTELRNRLMICAVTVLVLAIVGWFLFPWVWDVLQRPFIIASRKGYNAALNFQGAGTGLNVRLQLAAYMGLILSSPMIMLQTWLFVMPGLHKNERRYALGFFGAAIPLFFLGCVAGYWAVNQLIPVLLSFTPQEDQVEQLIRYDEYLALLVKTMLAFGIAFVIPVVMVVLNLMGLIRGRTMLKSWRWIIFLSFLFTAVMVPTPEPLTLIAMSGSIASLFFGAIVIAMLNDRRRDKREGTSQDVDRASRIDDAPAPIERAKRLDEIDEDTEERR